MSGEEIAVLEEKMKDNLFIKLQENFSSYILQDHQRIRKLAALHHLRSVEVPSKCGEQRVSILCRMFL